MHSLNKILLIKPNIIYPGHGPMIIDGKERIQNYIDHRNQRNEQIINCLKEANKPITVEEIVKNIYVGLNTKLIPAATYNVNNHLSYLDKHKLVGMYSYMFIVNFNE
jgi:endoribonuclease LACTB2